jgi:hypothetical protein
MIEYVAGMTTPAVGDLDSRPDLSPRDLAWRGIELCRQGDWQEGFYGLSLAAGATVDTATVPSLYFAYLGYGLARFQGQMDEGIRLCRLAVELDMYQTENYYCLASTLLLAGERRSAVDAVDRGVQIDATDDRLNALKAELGQRRPPLLPFLPRRHLVNRSLGRFRHRVFGPRKTG